MRNLSSQVLIGICFGILVTISFFALGNTAVVKPDNAATVEGIWEFISASPLTGFSRGYLGHKMSIVRKGDTYERNWLDGPDVDKPAAVYTGSPLRILTVFHDPIYNGSWTPGQGEGVPEPATMARETAGITFANTVSFTLSGDGNTLERSEDAVRLHWTDGHYTHHEVLKGFFKWTFRRIQPVNPSLAWEAGHPERKAWSDELRQAIAVNIGALDKATDIDNFAPKYGSLSASQRLDVWASLFVAVASFESPGFKPDLKYPEKDGTYSVGLLQLSYENQGFEPYGLEPLDRQAHSLEDPKVNLRCGVKILAYWVARDGVVASGSGDASRGGARYWSTLRNGHHITEIQKMVKDHTLGKE